jgi:hypothetical protein
MPSRHTNPNQLHNFKNLEENLQELLFRCRQLRQEGTENPDIAYTPTSEQPTLILPR